MSNEAIIPDFLLVPDAVPAPELTPGVTASRPPPVQVAGRDPATQRPVEPTDGTPAARSVARPAGDRGAPAGTWDDPDLHLVAARRLQGQAPPLHPLGSTVADLVLMIVRGLGAPPAYVVLALLVATAAVFGCTRRIRVTPAWAEPALLGGVLVGPPGTLKSPTCDLLLRPLLAIQDDERRRHLEHCRALENERIIATERDRLYRQAVREALLAGAPPPERPSVMAADLRDPPAPALVSTTGSAEGLRLRAAQSPTGLLLWRDELPRLAQEMRRSSLLRPLLLSALDGRAEAVDLVSRERLEAAHLSWCLLSTVQPEILPDLAEADDGLWSRLLWAVADYSDVTSQRGSAVPEALLETLFRKLRACVGDLVWGRNTPPVEMACAPRAAAALLEARRRWEQQGAREVGALASAYAKAAGLATRIAHAITQLRWGLSPHATAPHEVLFDDVDGAITLMDRFFLPAARSVLSVATPVAEEAAARALVEVILRRQLEEFSPRDDIQRRVGGPLADSKVLRDALRQLEAAGLVRVEAGPSGPAGGAPRMRVTVNPRLHEVGARR